MARPAPMQDPAMMRARAQAQMAQKMKMAQAGGAGMPQAPMGGFPGAGPMAGAPMQMRPPAPAMPMGVSPGPVPPAMAPQMNPAYAGGLMQMRQAQANPAMTKAPMMQGQAPSLTAPAAPAAPRPAAQAAPQPAAPPVPKMSGFS
jgi:hypothetical protein